MKPREFLNFFKTKSGRLVAFGALFAAALTIFGVIRKHQAAGDEPVSPLLSTNQPQVIHSLVRSLFPFNPPPEKPEPKLTVTEKSKYQTNFVSPPVAASLPAISLFADSGTETPKPKKTNVFSAPFGRLIPCETIITVDSSAIQTPIVGLVTENIFHAGRLVIPVGTEVHGTAQNGHARDRIASGDNWTFVWHSGEKLPLKAIALDREFVNATNQSGWGITDGSAGLRGEVIKADDNAELKMFGATFLSGAADALTEKQPTLFGSLTSRSLNNAPLVGAQDVLKTYAQQIASTLQRDGFYVRVPSGKQFYLYVLQTIDPADATKN